MRMGSLEAREVPPAPPPPPPGPRELGFAPLSRREAHRSERPAPPSLSLRPGFREAPRHRDRSRPRGCAGFLPLWPLLRAAPEEGNGHLRGNEMNEWTADELQTLAVAMPDSVVKHEDGRISPLVTKDEAHYLLNVYGAHYGLEPSSAKPKETTENAALEARYPTMFEK